jgi:hypothetical protein
MKQKRFFISRNRRSSAGTGKKGPGWAILLVGLMLNLSACDDRIIGGSYTVELPPPPESWTDLLGPPRWRVEWINRDGNLSVRETGYTGMECDPLEEWAGPVTAFPYWPDRGIPPEVMRPAGAIFPYDVRGGRICLSWTAGVEAWFYRKLAEAGAEMDAGKRIPQYFDWPRFRETLAGAVADEAVRRDPWLADWGSIAAQTVKSGFDRRRIKAEPREELPVTIPWEGPWIGRSPFAEPPDWEAGAVLSLGVTGTVETYVSSGGILRLTQGAWIWLPWE